MEPGRGIEPLFTAYDTVALPLDEPGIHEGYTGVLFTGQPPAITLILRISRL